MEKIAIIGNGIIGATLANYLDPRRFQVTVYDEPTGQATRASAGIISPWLSKRRNKKWTHLATDGAAFFPKLCQDFALTDDIYRQCGTLVIRPEKQLEELYELAVERKKEAPEIGELLCLTAAETNARLPLLNPQEALFVTGGGRLDGKAYLAHMTAHAKQKGVRFVPKRVHLAQENSVQVDDQTERFDRVVLTPGPHLKPLLADIGYHVDIRPQKGQLLVFETPYQRTERWPVAMLEGEADVIPFANGKILLGATHENEAGWDLSETAAAVEQLTSGTARFLAEPAELFRYYTHTRVGTRAYTSDFAPFFGSLSEHLLVASGLGSSGLTTGPYIGYLLAEKLTSGKADWENYQKPLATYIKN